MSFVDDILEFIYTLSVSIESNIECTSIAVYNEENYICVKQKNKPMKSDTSGNSGIIKTNNYYLEES